MNTVLALSGLALACAPAVEHAPPAQPAAEPAAASSRAAPEATAPVEEPDAREFLTNDVHSRYRKRSIARRYGAVRLSYTGEVVADPRASNVVPIPDLVVVAVHDRRARIVATHDTGRLVLWVELDDLAELVTKASVVEQRRADGEMYETSITLMPGYVATVRRRTGGRVFITHRGFKFEFDGWLPADRIGRVFDWGDFEKQEWSVPGMSHEPVRTGATIHEAPGGEVIARLAEGRSGDDSVYVAVGAEIAGWRSIHIANMNAKLRGFIRADQVLKDELGAILGMLKGGKAAPTGATLPAGTCVFDPATGDPVGVLDAPVDAELIERHADAFTLPLDTKWGKIEVALEPVGEIPSRGIPDEWLPCHPAGTQPAKGR